MSNAIKTITVTESEKLIERFKFNPPSTPQEHKKIRNKCMILLMLDAGLRVGEVVKIERNCLCVFGLPADSVVVPIHVAKGKTQRIIPMTGRLSMAVRMMQMHIWQPDGTCLEENAFYHCKPEHPLSRRQVQRIVADNSRIAFGRPITPHMLRHTFATRLMRITNSRMVQELLGHKNLATTQVYTHPDADDLKNAIGELDRINGCG